MGDEIQAMIDGIVLLNIPDELAWSLYIEGKNVDKIGLCIYTTYFPF